METKEIETTLGKYLEFKIFELFRDKLVGIVNEFSRESDKENIYNHLFLCPANLSNKRNFQIHGVGSPYVCLWRTSLFEWNKMFYGRSVLPRIIRYIGSDGKSKAVNGFMYDYTCTFELYSASYYKDFRDRVNQDLLDFDRLRFFDIDVSELLPDCDECITRCELENTGMVGTDKLDKEPRTFNLSAKYKLNVTIPYTHDGKFFDRIKLYVNNNLIYSKDYTE